MSVSWISVRVGAKRFVAEDIQSFELVHPDGDDLPPFTAGSHIDVEVQPGIVRQYSLCNTPGESRRYQIAVLRDPDSRGGSIGMHEALVEGGMVRISPPRNHFALDSQARRSILLGGGIGVTPLMAMARHLTSQNADFVLHYCTRSRSRTAFHDDLTEGPFAGNVHLHFDEGLEAQRLNPEQVLGVPEPGTHVYVCGPAGFIDWVFTAAKALGWPNEQLHREYFSATQPEASGDDHPFEVRIASSGASYTVPAGRTVVDILAEQGIVIPVSCQQGVCGTCITRVLDGEPDHRDLVLMGTEMDEFAPCCSRSRTPVLVLDL
ncbi:MAG: PDR/VanB family oxidoreductase [Brevundimonas sp.]